MANSPEKPASAGSSKAKADARARTPEAKPPAPAPDRFARTNLILAGVAAAVAIGGLVYSMSGGSGVKLPDGAVAESKAPVEGGLQAKLLEPGPLPENAMGKPDAPVTIIEYSSFSCGHCANFHVNVLPKLKEKYIDTGKVRYIIREFPLEPRAMGAAMLARCVSPMRYFSFTDVLYAQQKVWAFADNPADELLKIAREAGMTEERFRQCLMDRELEKNLNALRERGESAFGVESTPTFFINGKLLKGARGIEEFDQIIEPMLKG
jgi:protein-disulfide isomerase